MKGLYFYKLISKYSEDVTKNCKLTVNEIDSNFYTLKEADIISGEYDAETMSLILTRVGGEKIVVDLSGLAEGLTRNLSIDYDSREGTIIFRYNGNEVIVDGLITEDNIDDNLLSRVYTDSTLLVTEHQAVPWVLTHWKGLASLLLLLGTLTSLLVENFHLVPLLVNAM